MEFGLIAAERHGFESARQHSSDNRHRQRLERNVSGATPGLDKRIMEFHWMRINNGSTDSSTSCVAYRRLRPTKTTRNLSRFIIVYLKGT